MTLMTRTRRPCGVDKSVMYILLDVVDELLRTRIHGVAHASHVIPYQMRVLLPHGGLEIALESSDDLVVDGWHIQSV
jgi:hypothetical protein